MYYGLVLNFFLEEILPWKVAWGKFSVLGLSLKQVKFTKILEEKVGFKGNWSNVAHKLESNVLHVMSHSCTASITLLTSAQTAHKSHLSHVIIGN